MKGIKFFPDETNFNIIGRRHLAFAVSIIMVIGTFALVFTKGLNFGIDFTGGTLIEVRVPEAPVVSELRAELNDLGLGDISLQEFGENTDFMIRLPQQEGGPEAQQAAITKVRAALDAKFTSGPVDYRRTEFVGPQVGKELKFDALMATLWTVIGILVYIWFRFEWQFGVAAILALLHDVISVVGLFALTQMQFDLTTVAAVLMIAGYSINDTVVVFDRIRENMRKYKKMPLDELCNKALNQTLSRTIMTGVTTILALSALWLFGGEVLRGFIDALFFGVLLGTFSSIFVASPILLYLNLRPIADNAAEAEGQEQAG